MHENPSPEMQNIRRLKKSGKKTHSQGPGCRTCSQSPAEPFSPFHSEDWIPAQWKSAAHSHCSGIPLEEAGSVLHFSLSQCLKHLQSHSQSAVDVLYECTAMWVHSQNMFWLHVFLFLLAFVCAIWWVFALQRHLKGQLYLPESLRSSLYGQVFFFFMLGIEFLQRKQSFSFLDKEKQHTLFTFFLIFLRFFSCLVFLLGVEFPKLDD